MFRGANLNKLAAEICRRDISDTREVNITDVKRVLRHVSDLMAEEWDRNHDLNVAAALRRSGMRRLKKKKRDMLR